MAVYKPGKDGNLQPYDARGNPLPSQRSFKALTPKTKSFMQPSEPVVEPTPAPATPPSEGVPLSDAVRPGAELPGGAGQGHVRPSSAPPGMPGGFATPQAELAATGKVEFPGGGLVQGADVQLGAEAPPPNGPEEAAVDRGESYELPPLESEPPRVTKAAPTCALDGCSKALVKNKRGRIPKYCSPAHTAKAAYLRRKARTTGKGESHANPPEGEPS